MPAPYATEELVAEHKAALLDAAPLFVDAAAPSDAAFLRHLRAAARAISVAKRPRTQLTTVDLVAGQAIYDAPADLVAVKVSDWGSMAQHRPWDAPRAPLPSLRSVEIAGVAKLQLSPAPTGEQIAAYGSVYNLFYLANHQVPDTGDSTITERDVNLLLLRAKVEAMRELSIRNHNKPVTLRAGSGAGNAVQSKNMTPPALYESFLKEFNETP